MLGIDPSYLTYIMIRLSDCLFRSLACAYITRSLIQHVYVCFPGAGRLLQSPIHCTSLFIIKSLAAHFWEIYLLTHWNNICSCAIHVIIVHVGPVETWLDKWLKMTVLAGELFPFSHEHFECQYGTQQNWHALSWHDLLHAVRDLK